MTPDVAAQLRADVALVLAHVAADADGDYLIHHRRKTTFRILMHSLPRFGHGETMTAEHVANLEKVLAWVCFMTQWNGRRRTLTIAERDVQAAAFRLSDALRAAYVGR